MNEYRIKNGVRPTGDDMKTSLINGERIPKSHKVIRVFGCMERFNVDLQRYICLYGESLEKEDRRICRWLIMNLHSFGAFCYWKGEKPEYCFPEIILQAMDDRISYFEKYIDHCKDFMTYSHLKYIDLDLCRVNARELESAYATWYEFCYGKQTLKGDLKLMATILNRMSGYLWKLNRYLILKDGVDEIYWVGGITDFN